MACVNYGSPVGKQRELLHDLGLNVWSVDLQSGQKALDLVGDFSTSRNLGVPGRVWVELKTAGKQGFKKNVAGMLATVKAEFASLRRRDRSFGGVVLLVAECESLGEEWAPPSLKVYLLKSEAGQWRQLVGSTHKAARGQVVGKAAFAQLWDSLERHTAAGSGEKVRLLKHFLQALGKDCAHTVENLVTYNKLLRLSGCPERLKQEAVVEKSGLAPVVGDRDTFWELYKLL